MAYTPQHIANFFLQKAETQEMPITQLKLIKLVYIAYGWVLALKNEKLFNEQIEAWQHGPVIPSIYHEFKDFGKSAISKLATNFDLSDFTFSTPKIPKADEDTLFILERVWDIYKNRSGWELREKTHEQDSPWSKVYREGERGIKIRDDDISAHYKKKIRSYLDAAAKSE